MKLQKNHTYHINFIPDGRDTMELGYLGQGIYTGKKMTDTEGKLLFWFENLTSKKGFTESGWFSLEDVSLVKNHG
jgi:hypothetical protein